MPNELRQAFRHLMRHPRFVALVALTLGIGIAIVTTQFSLIDGVLLRPLPYPGAAALRHVAKRVAGPDSDGWDALRIEEFHALRERSRAFTRVAAYGFETYNAVHDGAPPRRLIGGAISGEFFAVLGVAPALGRGITVGEDQPGQPMKVVLSDGLWRDEFGADPAVIGRSIGINGETASIIGVMPPGFDFPGRNEIWVNLRAAPVAADASFIPQVEVLGSLADGATTAAAVAEADSILAAVQQATGRGNELRPRSVIASYPDATNNGSTAAMFYSLLAMTVLVLLLGCFNVANLLFVRADERARELALRTAMGAGRPRLVRQLLIESLILAAGGSAVGIALAAAGTRLLDVSTHRMLELPDWMRFDLNPRVLAVAVLAAALSGVLSGLMPALRASMVAPNDVLRENARGSLGMRRGSVARWLIAGQIGFACCALVMAALFAVSAIHASRSTLGYDPDHLLCGRIELQAPAYDTPADRSRFYERLLARVKALPGVAAAAVSSRDLVANGVYGPFEVEGVAYDRPTDKPAALLEVVSREYFDVVRRGAVRGRVFETGDRADSPPVALVNTSFAAQVWPGEDPLGKRIRRSEGGARWATVVGVVPDLDLQGVGNTRNGAGYYLLQDQMGWGWLDLLVRTEGDAAAVAPALRLAVAEIDPRLPIHTIGTVSERQARSLAGLTIISSMTTVFAIAALLLASVGIYGVTSAMARRRHHEFGMRVALGAGSECILRLMFLGSAPQTAVGIAGGIAIGALLVRPLRPMTVADGSDELLVYVVVGVVLGATALLSTLVPALRAARADPMAVLRGD